MSFTRRRFSASIGAALAAAGLPQMAHAQAKTIALMFDSLNSEFWVAGIKIMKAELAKRGFTTIESISDQDDNKQFEQVRAMIARKVGGIIIVQTDSNAVIPAIKAANAANIPMVHFNRPAAPNDAYSVSVTADNKTIARDAVDAGAKVATAGGKKRKACILVGNLGDPNALGRRDGFAEAVAKYPGIEVVARVPTEWNADKAFAGLTNAFQANPDIDFLFTSSDFMLPQIQQVLKSADRWAPIGDAKHVTLVGFDGFPSAYQMMKDKYMDACGVQNLFLESRLVLDAIADMQAGKKPEKVLLDPGFAITQANMAQKQAEMWGYVLWKEKN